MITDTPPRRSTMEVVIAAAVACLFPAAMVALAVSAAGQGDLQLIYIYAGWISGALAVLFVLQRLVRTARARVPWPGLDGAVAI